MFNRYLAKQANELTEIEPQPIDWISVAVVRIVFFVCLFVGSECYFLCLVCLSSFFTLFPLSIVIEIKHVSFMVHIILLEYDLLYNKIGIQKKIQHLLAIVNERLL